MISYVTKSLKTAATLALLLSLVPAAWAGEPATRAAPEVAQNVEQGTEQRTAEKREQVLAEATQAIRATQDALKLLDERKRDEALAALERATGKLEIILARQPDLALAPAEVSTMTYDVVASPEAIEKLREASEDALEDGQLQAARRLISDLANEVVISVTNIPLASYPAAIRTAASLIEKDKLETAASVLHTALNTLVVSDTVIPLPVARARELLQEAATLAVKKERSEEQDSLLEGYLADAREELEFAELLGYGGEEDFAGLYTQLDAIEDRVHGGDSPEGLFAEVQDLLDDTVEAVQPSSS